MKTMRSSNARLAVTRLPTIVTFAAAVAFLSHGPIPQLADYHNFADQRTFLSIPHAFDVLSNAGFLLVGLVGVRRVVRSRERALPNGAWYGYMVFCGSLIATGVGSAYYHLAPDDAWIVWDRLPIAVACAGLLAGVRAECSPGTGDSQRLVLLAIAAVSSVMWWRVTGISGEGDLRPYLLLQVLPLVVIPLWQMVYAAPRQRRAAFGIAMALYVAAKTAELGDHVVFRAFGIISGHTIKHLLATVAAAAIVRVIAPSPNLDASADYVGAPAHLI